MAVAQVGSLITLVDATTIEAADFNSNYADLRTAFNALVTGANQLAGGISVNGALTVISGGFTVTAGVLSQDDATDTTSTVTGSIHTDGGVGIAKALWVGTTSQLVGAVSLDATLQVDGNTLLGTTTAATGSPRLDIVGSRHITVSDVTTDATQKFGTTGTRHYTNAEEPVMLIGGNMQTSANKVFVGGGLSSLNAATVVEFYTAANTTTTTGTLAADISGVGTSSTLRTRGNITVDKVLSVDDTTETTSATDGSIHTDGGVGIAKKLYVAGQATFAGGMVISDNVSRVGAATTDVGTPEDTSDNVLQTVNITANDMGTNGGVRIIARGQVAGSANTKTVRLKFGATTVSDVIWAAGETGSYYITATAFNRNSASAQVWWGFEYEEAVISEISIITSAIDTTAQVAVTLTGQTADAADEITAELLAVELIKD